MFAAHMSRHHRCEVTARALEGHRLLFDPCRSRKVLGSWCGDCGGSSEALLAYLQAGNGAFFRRAELLRDKTLTMAGRARAFETACTSSALHGSETLLLDSSGLRRLRGWEGRWLRSTKRFRRELGDAPALHEEDGAHLGQHLLVK